MTEDEAKTKWCPMLGAKTREHGSTIYPDSVNCIGSACMMWVWTVNSVIKLGRCGLTNVANP